MRGADADSDDHSRNMNRQMFWRSRKQLKKVRFAEEHLESISRDQPHDPSTVLFRPIVHVTHHGGRELNQFVIRHASQVSVNTTENKLTV
jgi:hypothetical protein